MARVNREGVKPEPSWHGRFLNLGPSRHDWVGTPIGDAELPDDKAPLRRPWPASEFHCPISRAVTYFCGVEMWRGGVGAAYLLPALSSAGASIATPCFRFHIPLIEPDGRISRFRLSEKGSRCRPRETTRPPGKAD